MSRHAQTLSKDQDPLFWQQCLQLCDEAEVKNAPARNIVLKCNLFEALHEQNIWNELRYRDLLPKRREHLNGLLSEDLNKHFAGVLISQDEGC